MRRRIVALTRLMFVTVAARNTESVISPGSGWKTRLIVVSLVCGVGIVAPIAVYRGVVENVPSAESPCTVNAVNDTLATPEPSVALNDAMKLSPATTIVSRGGKTQEPAGGVPPPLLFGEVEN